MTIKLKLFFCILVALIAFAANSVLCRLALLNTTERLIDPLTFTIVRLLSGSLVLMGIGLLVPTSRRSKNRLMNLWQSGSWRSSSALFLYALCFSFAYVSLSTGVGALILFGAVQLTLVFLSFRSGEHLNLGEWSGLVIAFMGLVYLVLPTLSTPSLMGFCLMLIAGIAWGIYTWRGKTSIDAMQTTASNFIRTLPFIFICLFFLDFGGSIKPEGVLLAIMSGALMSGVGYAIWYSVLTYIRASMAAVLQLLVPILATFGGVVFANEAITLHLLISTLAVLGGVLIVIRMRAR